MYYFGQALPEFMLSSFPEALSERSEHERHGLPMGKALIHACDADGFCKVFHLHSTVTGDGRMDIDLGSARWRVEVVDGESGQPVPGAAVLVRGREAPPEIVHFFDDNLVPAKPAREALTTFSDRRGLAGLRGLSAGPYGLGVRAEGYQPFGVETQLLAGEVLETRVELDRERDSGGPTLRLESGQVATQAVVIGFAEEGATHFHCSKPVNAYGQLTLPDSCLRDDSLKLVALHPRARLRRLSSSELRQGGDIELTERRGRPLRLRLVDPEGNAVVGESLELHFPGFVLGPDELLLARRGGAGRHQTDHRGEIAFGFLEADGLLPKIVLPRTGQSFLIGTVPATGKVELVVE